MAFIRMTWPLFGPAIEAALSLEVKYDKAAMMSRESGIPLRRIRRLPGDTEVAKNSVYSVSIRSVGGHHSEYDRNQHRQSGLPIPEPLHVGLRRAAEREEQRHNRLPDDGEYQSLDNTIECAGFGVRRERVEDGGGHESRQKKREYTDHFTGCPTHSTYRGSRLTILLLIVAPPIRFQHLFIEQPAVVLIGQGPDSPHLLPRSSALCSSAPTRRGPLVGRDPP